MAGRKRAAPEGEGTTTRSSKTAKTGETASSSKSTAKGGRKGAKASLPVTAFKSRATPLQVNVMHASTSETADSPVIASATLDPTTFSTGSYGWKGSKRIEVELPSPNGGEEKEKVKVMMTINLTVVGSKNAKAEGETQEEEAAEVPEGEKANGEAPEQSTVPEGEKVEDAKEGE